MKSIRQWRIDLWQRWLNRRIPPVTKLALNHKNIFILPSRTGLAFVALLISMLLTAINYQNALVYALTFWLLSVGHGTIWLTFRNLSGLNLAAGKGASGYLGDTFYLPVRLSSSKGWAVALNLGYPGHEFADCTLGPNTSETLNLAFVPEQRGYLPLRRLKIQTCYPFGMFTAWSWVALEYPVLVYPKPDHTPLHLAQGSDGEAAASLQQARGNEDVAGIREYGYGDSMQQIAWKHSARTGELKSLEREQDDGALCWLDWASLAGVDAEVRLSRLTSWVDQAEQANWRYGLRVPGVEIAPGNGDQHRIACLEALALWQPDSFAQEAL
jgi:uncharacterized protein (DUF58 family)